MINNTNQILNYLPFSREIKNLRSLLITIFSGIHSCITGRYENNSEHKSILKIISLIALCLFLVGCSGGAIKNKNEQLYLNGLLVKAIYYDDTEDPIGYGKYSAYLFIFPDNQFVILRSRENVDNFLSELPAIESKFPSAKRPVKYSIAGNKILALDRFDHSNDNGFKPHVYYNKYEGEYKNDTFHITRSSWYSYPDGRVKNNPSVSWDFKKIRTYQ